MQNNSGRSPGGRGGPRRNSRPGISNVSAARRAHDAHPRGEAGSGAGRVLKPDSRADHAATYPVRKAWLKVADYLLPLLTVSSAVCLKVRSANHRSTSSRR